MKKQAKRLALNRESLALLDAARGVVAGNQITAKCTANGGTCPATFCVCPQRTASCPGNGLC